MDRILDIKPIKVIGACFLLSAFIGFSACADKTSCGIADSIDVLKNFYQGKTAYTLIRRTSGLQDKVDFYELYETAPRFDDCGEADSSPISKETVDDSKGGIAKLIVKDRAIQIMYSKNKPQSSDLSNISVEIK